MMTSHPELQTIRDFIRYATSRFNEASLYYGHGTTNAWDEAFALILHTLHLSHEITHTILDAHLIKEEREALLSLIDKRITKRIPVPYLTHQAWFAGLSFYVDERVLVPRSSFAELINAQFTPWIDVEKTHDILDLCTGSGCIAIACAKAFPDAEVDASDISVDALAVAKINVLRHNLENQINLYESDLFTQLPAKKYDLIVSNPPYVDAEDMATLPPEYLHEPQLGLVAGNDGLTFVKRILEKAKDFLHPHGVLIVEVGNSEEALAESMPHIPFTWLSFEESEGGVFLLTAQQLSESLPA